MTNDKFYEAQKSLIDGFSRFESEQKSSNRLKLVELKMLDFSDTVQVRTDISMLTTAVGE